MPVNEANGTTMNVVVHTTSMFSTADKAAGLARANVSDSKVAGSGSQQQAARSSKAPDTCMLFYFFLNGKGHMIIIIKKTLLKIK